MISIKFIRSKYSFSASIFFYFFLIVHFSSCKSEKGTPEFGNYPTDIGRIITTRCATPGCHTSASKEAASGLSLETWNSMFEGGRSGSDIIPFRPEYSPLLFFSNIYPDLGLTATPTMPYNSSVLPRHEIELLRNWILQGAPDAGGFIKFSDNALRKKFYVSNQGCDVITVFDLESALPMRYINAGNSGAIESPHMIRVSPDGKYFYTVFTGGNIVQRFSTVDESLAGEINIGSGNWNTLAISSDSKKAFAVDWSANGRVAYLDLELMSLIQIWSGTKLFEYPHGSIVNKTNDTLYLTGQTGNYIYKVPINDPASPIQVSVDGNAPLTTSSLNIHEIAFSPDYSKYFVTCQTTNEVRVLQTSNDSLLKVINVGLFPQELSISTTTNYLFVSCPEDTITFPGSRGSVAVIDYVTNTLITKIFTGFQPHGLAVDDNKHLVYVANRNATTKGPAPHHAGVCGGRNGYLTIIDMTTMQLLKNEGGNDKRIELSVDPYSVAIR